MQPQHGYRGTFAELFSQGANCDANSPGNERLDQQLLRNLRQIRWIVPW